MSVPVSGATLQPWNQVIFPGSQSNYPLLPTMSPSRARSLPAVARVIGLIAGMIKQMPLDVYQSDGTKAPRPRLLEQPDPTVARSWWVGMQVEDYLLNGNAVGLITSRSVADGYPLTIGWVPAEWVTVILSQDGRSVSYWVGGTELPYGNVVHVRRGADRSNPFRGVGLVEQHLDQLGLIDDQVGYQRSMLQGSSVPSVAVIAPASTELTQTTADLAKASWVEKYGGPVREPAVLPAGTQVIPLAWSPHDSQMVEASKLSLTDVANMANLDGYWLGAPSGSFTYQSPGPMYVNLVRQTVGPICEDIEGTWSMSWVPRGKSVQFDRNAVLRDDMQTMVTTAKAAVDARLWTKAEARAYLGMPADVPAELMQQPQPQQDPQPAAAGAAGQG